MVDTKTGMDSSEDFMPQRVKKKRRRWLPVTVGLLVLAGAGFYWMQRGDEQVQIQPLIVTVGIGDIENTIAATGSLRPSELVEVGARVSGQLQVLHVQAGDYVEQGQLLAEIDASQQASRVEASRATLAGQEAQLDSRRSALLLAEANAERQQRLMAEDATSQLDYDNAMNNLASARSALIQLERQIDQSRASLAIDETELNYTRVTAPISGTVISVAMSEGRTLNASQQAPTILTIADLSRMKVEAEISEADIPRLKQGMEVYFTTLGGGNRRWYSELLQILPQPIINNNVVLYTGVFDIDNSDGTLLPQMTAQVFFVTSAAREVVTVPIGALTFADPAPASAGAGFAGTRLQADGAARNTSVRPMPAAPEAGSRLARVQLANEDGSFSEREVLIGITSRVAAEVISGLRPGERVVAGILEVNAGSSNAPAGGGFGGPMMIRGLR